MLSIETIKVDYLSLDEHYLKKFFCDDVIGLQSIRLVLLQCFCSHVTPRLHVKASGGGEEK